jgi:hypothetical protein
MDEKVRTSRGSSSGAGTATVLAPARPLKDSPTTRRLNVNLPEAKFLELEALAKDSNRTMTDVVRIALELVKIAVNLEAQGHRLAVVDNDGKLVKEVILIR